MTLTLVSSFIFAFAVACFIVLREASRLQLRCSRCRKRAAFCYTRPLEGRLLCPDCEAAENEVEYRTRKCSRCGVVGEGVRWTWRLPDGYRCAPCRQAAFEEACAAASCATCGGRPVTQFFDGQPRCEEHARKSGQGS